MRPEIMRKMKSYPGFPVLLAMMDRGYSPLTISTAVGSMQMHSNPTLAAEKLMKFLQRPETTEKAFWRYLQDEVMEIPEMDY